MIRVTNKGDVGRNLFKVAIGQGDYHDYDGEQAERLKDSKLVKRLAAAKLMVEEIEPPKPKPKKKKKAKSKE